ncbi:hypothetical protein FA15DRAFT_672949 [Coprinopsis marcescibilis]|uniref:Uncharacterized protein n=1 Tax=Coprinopsis marcescibilis TaxID=230819 RepID=A0A5C3KLX9_COPMA|nr:hypothetical protein FA15DRAFT_672949 [Coprinopsis marcescibilis]
MSILAGATDVYIENSHFQCVTGSVHNNINQNFDSNGRLVSSSFHTRTVDPNPRSTTYQHRPSSPSTGHRSSLHPDKVQPDQGPATNEPGSGPRPAEGETVIPGNDRCSKDGKVMDDSDPVTGDTSKGRESGHDVTVSSKGSRRPRSDLENLRCSKSYSCGSSHLYNTPEL